MPHGSGSILENSLWLPKLDPSRSPARLFESLILDSHPDLSPKQARELIAEYGHDREKLLDRARTRKAEADLEGLCREQPGAVSGGQGCKQAQVLRAISPV